METNKVLIEQENKEINDFFVAIFNNNQIVSNLINLKAKQQKIPIKIEDVTEEISPYYGSRPVKETDVLFEIRDKGWNKYGKKRITLESLGSLTIEYKEYNCKEKVKNSDQPTHRMVNKKEFFMSVKFINGKASPDIEFPIDSSIGLEFSKLLFDLLRDLNDDALQTYNSVQTIIEARQQKEKKIAELNRSEAEENIHHKIKNMRKQFFELENRANIGLD